MLSTQIPSNIDTKLILKDSALIVHSIQDCDPIADWCKEQVAIGNTGSKDIKFVGRIPDVMVENYCNRNNLTFGEFLSNKDHIRAIMRDPALQHFRIWKGKI